MAAVLPCCDGTWTSAPPRQSLPPSSTPRDGQAMECNGQGVECAGLSCQHDRLCYCARLRPSWPQQLRWARTVMSCHGREHRTLSPSTVQSLGQDPMCRMLWNQDRRFRQRHVIRTPGPRTVAVSLIPAKGPRQMLLPRHGCRVSPRKPVRITYIGRAPSLPGRAARVDHIPATAFGHLN